MFKVRPDRQTDRMTNPQTDTSTDNKGLYEAEELANQLNRAHCVRVNCEVNTYKNLIFQIMTNLHVGNSYSSRVIELGISQDIICAKCPKRAKARAFRRLHKSLIALLIVVCGKSL